MVQEERKLIDQVNIEKVSQNIEKEKTKIASVYVDEWVYFLPRSSNIQSIIFPILRDPYSFYKDSKVP